MKDKHMRYATNTLDSSLHTMWYHFSVKNLVGRLGVHDRTCLAMGKSGQSGSRYFARMLQPCGMNTCLKEHSNWVYLSPRLRFRRVCQGLSLLIQVQPRKHFNMQTLSMNYTKNNFNSSCLID